ncbi:MAG: tetratricopeptide repeat protein [Verrucomicrobia bacterium]|nr:tetratricopeptide repeat protein [Verrucomicrobiota bacterium]
MNGLPGFDPLDRKALESGGGMEMFSESAVSLDDPARAGVVRHFRDNMEDVIRTGTRHGAHVLVMPAVVNLLDCGPMASVARDPSWIQKASELWKNQEWDSLRISAEKQLDRTPQSADAAYFLGLAESGLGHSDLALEAFTRACDWDLLPFRATTPLRRSLLSLDGLGSGVEVSDPFHRMLELTGEAVPGARTFFEHVHLTPLGNYGLAVHTAEKLLQPIQTILGGSGPSGSIPGFEHCRDMLGLTPFDMRSMASTMTSRVSEPPLNERPGSRENRDHLLQLAASITRDEINRSDSLYQFALAQRSTDWMIRQRFAIYLDETGRYSDALESIEIALDQVPHSPVLYFQRGVVLEKLNRHADAVASFRQALKLRPSFAEAHLQIAWIDWRDGHRARAIQGFQKSRQIDPNNESAQLALMIAWKESGEAGKYVEGLRSMLKDFPRSPMVQKELAHALANPDHRAKFQDILESIADEDMRDTGLLISRARQYRSQNRFDESLELLLRALAIDPESTPAHYQIGLNQIQREEYAQAIPHFLSVIAREPEFWSAHFNLGVALAKMNQIDAACASLAVVPEGDANYEKAQEYLRRLEPYRKVPRC